MHFLAERTLSGASVASAAHEISVELGRLKCGWSARDQASISQRGEAPRARLGMIKRCEGPELTRHQSDAIRIERSHVPTSLPAREGTNYRLVIASVIMVIPFIWIAIAIVFMIVVTSVRKD
jgi:hypothetical protein